MTKTDLLQTITDTRLHAMSYGCACRIVYCRGGYVIATTACESADRNNGETILNVDASGRVTGELLLHAREWLLDCFTSEDCQTDIEDCSPVQLIGSVNKYYAGGIGSFLADCFDLRRVLTTC